MCFRGSGHCGGANSFSDNAVGGHGAFVWCRLFIDVDHVMLLQFALTVSAFELGDAGSVGCSFGNSWFESLRVVCSQPATRSQGEAELAHSFAIGHLRWALFITDGYLARPLVLRTAGCHRLSKAWREHARSSCHGQVTRRAIAAGCTSYQVNHAHPDGCLLDRYEWGEP